MEIDSWSQLNEQIIACQRCPRLIEYCREIARTKRKSYADQSYWGRPVPNFGPRKARLVIVGLAPGAHGANRTGRMFTGDRSGDWLYRALHKAGFATQPESVSAKDGLRLRDCLITAACHCAPPDNRPTANELATCSDWLAITLDMVRPQVIVALGQIAWNGVFRLAKQCGWHQAARPKFGHGAEFAIPDQFVIVGSYHPSQQNTFTGRLTEAMLDEVFDRARAVVDRE